MNDETPSTPPPSDAPATVQQPRTPLRDRTFRIRSMAAVAVAALVIGGGAGAAIGVVAGGDDHPDHPGQAGFGGPPRGGPQFDQGPEGQLPPGRDDSEG